MAYKPENDYKIKIREKTEWLIFSFTQWAKINSYSPNIRVLVIFKVQSGHIHLYHYYMCHIHYWADMEPPWEVRHRHIANLQCSWSWPHAHIWSVPSGNGQGVSELAYIISVENEVRNRIWVTKRMYIILTTCYPAKINISQVLYICRQKQLQYLFFLVKKY